MSVKKFVIGGFAGIGKTTLGRKFKNVIDLESIYYKWVSDFNSADFNEEVFKGKPDRVLNSNFPNNYIEAIKNALKEYDVVLISSTVTEIQHFLKENDIKLFFVMPQINQIEIIEKRMKERGNIEEFIKGTLDFYNLCLQGFPHCEHEFIFLNEDEFLEDVLKNNENFKHIKLDKI